MPSIRIGLTIQLTRYRPLPSILPAEPKKKPRCCHPNRPPNTQCAWDPTVTSLQPSPPPPQPPHTLLPIGYKEHSLHTRTMPTDTTCPPFVALFPIRPIFRYPRSLFSSPELSPPKHPSSKICGRRRKKKKKEKGAMCVRPSRRPRSSEVTPAQSVYRGRRK